MANQAVRRPLFRLSLIAVALLVTGCGTKRKGNSDPTAANFANQIQEFYDQFLEAGVQLTLGGEIIADLSQLAPVVSSYGTVSRGTTLNYLSKDGVDFVVYGEDGVFAAECEVSTLDSSYGPSHPLCQVFGAESFDKLIVCFANSEGADITVAQSWPGTLNAFDEGKGMICYVNGVRMDSTHVFTY